MYKKKGFTLIELMGVLAIIGILTVILVPVINNAIKNNKQELYNNQIELIKLSAKNLTSDNRYILPEEEEEEIYITLGQLRDMGYAEETIINPLTKENFPDSMIVIVIKREKDYDYEVEIKEVEEITSLGIIVSQPSHKYIRQGIQSSYIITAKEIRTVEDKTTEYYIDMDKSNITLKGEANSEQIKYKLDGNNGLYKLTLLGGEKEGSLYFNFNNLKGIDDIDISEINEDLDEKQIIVDNTVPTCNWSGERTAWKNTPVTITLTGTDNYKMNESKTTFSRVYTGSGIEIKTSNLSYEIEDEAGNKTTCSKTANVYYDTLAPSKPVISGNNGSYTSDTWTKNDVTMSYLSTDSGSGNVYYQYSHDNSNWINDNSDNGFVHTSTTWTISWSSSYNYYIRACDAINNCSLSDMIKIKIDKWAPEINSVSVGNCSNNKRTVTINSSDSLSGISGYNITTSSSIPSSFNSSSSGSYSPGTYYVWVKDNAGNVSSKQFTVGTCITASDICNASENALFGTSKGDISGNYGSWYNVPSSWGTTWCNGRCDPTGGYQRICSSSTCSYYGIYGLTAWQINDTYGCKFAKLWCSCS